ncbi:hypothetical protein NE237_021444 [Protea cynaroides]|uniref:Uncharacterized protein n=1 Tax=Protea cynaroides TaxID=273540 RepID=A0A9Q0K2L6_9MAGN|nr:hypothetical protein NE237_021444 [Protea cynaroides]
MVPLCSLLHIFGHHYNLFSTANGLIRVLSSEVLSGGWQIQLCFCMTLNEVLHGVVNSYCFKEDVDTSEGGNAATDRFNSYRDQANVGDEAFQSYNKGSNAGKMNFVNYGNSFNEGTDKFNQGLRQGSDWYFSRIQDIRSEQHLHGLQQNCYHLRLIEKNSPKSETGSKTKAAA